MPAKLPLPGSTHLPGATAAVAAAATTGVAFSETATFLNALLLVLPLTLPPLCIPSVLFFLPAVDRVW
jgi:hypothetical protein